MEEQINSCYSIEPAFEVLSAGSIPRYMLTGTDLLFSSHSPFFLQSPGCRPPAGGNAEGVCFYPPVSKARSLTARLWLGNCLCNFLPQVRPANSARSPCGIDCVNGEKQPPYNRSSRGTKSLQSAYRLKSHRHLALERDKPDGA